MNSSVRQSVIAFVAAVSAAWPAVTTLLGTSERSARNALIDDWLQAMWEMLVEASLPTAGGLMFLEVYGEGADCNPRSSRVHLPEASPTHAIRCSPVSGADVADALTRKVIDWPDEGLVVDRFVRLDGAGWYDEAPPFDHVLVSTGGYDAVLPTEDLDFTVGRPLGKSAG